MRGESFVLLRKQVAPCRTSLCVSSIVDSQPVSWLSPVFESVATTWSVKTLKPLKPAAAPPSAAALASAARAASMDAERGG